jgi:hypothetical protein
MHSATFIQQLRKVKGLEYFENSNYSTHSIKEGMFLKHRFYYSYF